MVFKKSKKPTSPPAIDVPAAAKQLDPRVGFDGYRDFFTVKNYWKTVNRKADAAGRLLLYRYIKTNPDCQLRYDRLKNVNIESMDCADSIFENMAKAYLKVFDDVIETIESKPADASDACRILADVGKRHKSKVPGMKSDEFQQLEAPFLYMIQEVLEDRFNEKAENLFRKFFQFCLKHIQDGFGH